MPPALAQPVPPDCPLAPQAARRAGRSAGLLAGAPRVLAALALFSAFGAAPALAQDAPYAAVQRQTQAGELAPALAQAQAWLAQHPQDAQMRFLRAVLLQRLGQTEAALQSLTELTRAHPELPEPHNNLAVLHAAAGRLAQAQAALEEALRLHPHYGTAWRNLGDVQLLRALESYRQALQHSPHAPGLAQRAQALQALLGTAATPVGASSADPPAAAPAALPVPHPGAKAAPGAATPSAPSLPLQPPTHR